MFGGPVRADRISFCPLDRVLTYKNLIYLLNLQFSTYVRPMNDPLGGLFFKLTPLKLKKKWSDQKKK